jgi:hypothetical protein
MNRLYYVRIENDGDFSWRRRWNLEIRGWIFFHLSGRGVWQVWGREGVHTVFWWGHLWGRCHFEDLGVHGRIILKLNFLEVQWGGVDCIGLSQDRDQWRGVVNAVLNIMLCNKPTNAQFYILLTVNLDVILVTDQVDALFFNVFISCLYMFRATSAHNMQRHEINTLKKHASIWSVTRITTNARQ